MKKIVMFMMLAVATFMNASAHADHNESFGYFYLTNTYDSTVESGSVIDWTTAHSFLDEDATIVIDNDPHNILIKNTGFYRVTWILTLDTDEPSGEADIQFGLRFQDTGFTDFGLVPGSTYGVGNAFDEDPVPLLGQAVILVAHPNSLLELSNESEFDAFLESFEGQTVCASIRIERLGDLD